jgi:hypothetical protein
MNEHAWDCGMNTVRAAKINEQRCYYTVMLIWRMGFLLLGREGIDGCSEESVELFGDKCEEYESLVCGFVRNKSLVVR